MADPPVEFVTPSKLGLKQRPEGENATSLSGMTTEEKTRQRKQNGLPVEGSSDVVQPSEAGSEKSKKSKESKQSQRSRKLKKT